MDIRATDLTHWPELVTAFNLKISNQIGGWAERPILFFMLISGNAACFPHYTSGNPVDCTSFISKEPQCKTEILNDSMPLEKL